MLVKKLEKCVSKSTIIDGSRRQIKRGHEFLEQLIIPDGFVVVVLFHGYLDLLNISYRQQNHLNPVDFNFTGMSL